MLSQGKIDEVINQLNTFFEKGQRVPTAYKELFLSLAERIKNLKHEKAEGILVEDVFENKKEEIKYQLKDLIGDIAGFSKPEKKRSEPKKQGARRSRNKPSSSIFDKIIGTIKKIPGAIFSSGNKSETQSNTSAKKSKPVDRHNDGFFEEKKTAPPPAPIVDEPSGAPVFERMEPSSSAPNEDILKPPSLGPKPSSSAPSAPSPTQAGGTQSPFQQGKILYAIPSQMCIGKEIRCTIRIAPDQFSIKEMESGLSDKEKSSAKNEGIKITSVMKVELEENSDVANFDINNRSTAEQPILPFGFTEWAFDVKARRPGHHALLLRVSAKINIPGFGERSFDVAVLDRAILVNTNERDQNNTVPDFAEQSIPDPEWNNEDENVVLAALEKGRIDQAIERIANFVQDKDRDFHTDLILLHARWNDNTNQLQEKRITAADWDIVNNKVRFAITQLLDQLKVSFAPDSMDKVINWKKERGKLSL